MAGHCITRSQSTETGIVNEPDEPTVIGDLGIAIEHHIQDLVFANIDNAIVNVIDIKELVLPVMFHPEPSSEIPEIHHIHQ